MVPAPADTPGAPADAAAVYQLRVVLRGISPLIWRRLLVRADATIAELHEVLQVAFGWGGEHLHRFAIHGGEYGISYAGGIGFDEDARAVRLARFALRVGERFVYEYDLADGWRHDVRVEAVRDAEARRVYPRCVGGRRAGPPEDCGGPAAFLELAQYWSWQAPVRVAEILGDLLDKPDSVLGEHREALDELAGLLPWLRLEHFDRRALNRALAGTTLSERNTG